MEGGWTEVAGDAPCLLPRPQVHPGNSAEANGYFSDLAAEDKQWAWGLLLEAESSALLGAGGSEGKHGVLYKGSRLHSWSQIPGEEKPQKSAETCQFY